MNSADYSSMSDDELLSLYNKGGKSNGKTDYSSMSDEELLSMYKKNKKPQKSYAEKVGRISSQYALGAAQNILLPYEIAVQGGTSEGYLFHEGQHNAYEDIVRLTEKKQQRPKEFSEADQNLLEYYNDLVKNPEKQREKIPKRDFGIRDLTEKVTGLDLQPEGILENAANWMGFLKDPKKLKDLAKFGLKPFEAIKSILPTPMETTRGLSAGTALDLAEQGQLGPWSTLGVAVMADVTAHGPKAIFDLAKEPKKTAARITNAFTGGNSKKAWTNDLINEAREAGIQLDAGTITGSPFIQWLQARAAQSGLTGKALEEFRKDLSGQILREYNVIADELGNMVFENNHQASEAIKSSLKVQEENLNRFLPEATSKNPENAPTSRSLQGRIAQEARPSAENDLLLNRISPEEFPNDYVAGETLKTVAEDIKAPIKEQFNERWSRLNTRMEMIPAGPHNQLANEMETFVNDNRGSLLLGESTPEHRVVNAAQRLMTQLRNELGELQNITVSDLIKTKRTLQDVANYEFGGSNFQSKYKKLVDDVDSAIRRTLSRQSDVLLDEFHQLNSEYSLFKDTFENKNVMQLFEPKNQNYNAIYNSYVTNPDKLRSIEDMFYASPRGQQISNQIKRDFADRLISKPNINSRDINNLTQALGPEFAQDISEYWQARQFIEQNPIPRAQIGQRIGIEVPQTTKKPNQGRNLKVKETDIHKRQKLFEFLKKKSSEEIMKMFDTLDGIKKLKNVLNLTEEGKQLYKDLSRYKLSEMIDKNMKNSMTEQVKLGTFSNLLKTSKNKAIIKELLGPENYNRLIRLQKVSGKLAESANKFFNASQSGTTLTDVSLVSTAVLGVFTGNPYLALPAIGKIGGMRVIANLMADKEFLKILEEIVMSPKSLKTPIQIEESLRKMQPYVQQAMLESQNENEKRKN